MSFRLPTVMLGKGRASVGIVPKETCPACKASVVGISHGATSSAPLTLRAAGRPANLAVSKQPRLCATI